MSDDKKPKRPVSIKKAREDRHEFRACRVFTYDGAFYQCGRVGCTSEAHAVQAKLMGAPR